MARTTLRPAIVGALLLIVALPGIAGAGARIPVDSVDDPGQPLANRVAAVTQIVEATNARLGRVIAAWPPNPCLEISEMCDSWAAGYAAYDSLADDLGDVCLGRAIEGAGATTISDADADAADTSATGIGRQLGSIAIVLANADRRLGVIFPPNPVVPDPGPPEAPQLVALAALYDAVVAGGEALVGWGSVPPNPIWPPNPCLAVGG